MRLITETQAPRNIFTFKAQSYDQALEKAAAGLKDEAVQGCVWLREGFRRVNTPSPMQFYALLESEIIGGNSELSRINPVFGLPSTDWFRLAARIEKSGNTLFPDSDLMRSLMHPEVGDVLKYFTSCFMTLRFVTETSATLHIDNAYQETSLFKNLFSRKLFGTKSIRMIEYEGDIPGTLVYDPADVDKNDYMAWVNSGNIYPDFNKTPEPWMVRSSDVLILTNTSWPRRKVLIHSEPKIERCKVKDARAIRIYDCFPT